MTERARHIHIFKTNICSDPERQRVKRIFAAMEHIEDCHVDIEDIDKVLRVVSYRDNVREIMEAVKGQGHECQELE